MCCSCAYKLLHFPVHWVFWKDTHMQGEIMLYFCLIHSPALLQCVTASELTCFLAVDSLCAAWWGSTTLLISMGSQPPSAAFPVPLHSLIMEKVTSGGHIRACGLFVYKSKEKVLVKYAVSPSSCAAHVLTMDPFPYSSSPPSITFFACLLHPVPR